MPDLQRPTGSGPETARADHDALVDFYLQRMGHLFVLEDLAQCAAVAATDDHDPARGRVRKQGRMRHHLVVEEVVARSQHDEAVDDHKVAEGLGRVDLNALVFTPLVVQFLANHEREGGAVLLAGLCKPLVVMCDHFIFLRAQRGYKRYKIIEAGHKNILRNCLSLATGIIIFPSMNWDIESARGQYNIPGWSAGYFDVGSDGHLVALPGGRADAQAIDLTGWLSACTRKA